MGDVSNGMVFILFLLLVIPFDLEFDFFFAVFTFMFDIEYGVLGYIDALSGDLDIEPLAFFKAIGQATQLLNELRCAIGFFRYRGLAFL